MRPTPQPDAWCNEWEFLSSIMMTEMMTPRGTGKSIYKGLGRHSPIYKHSDVLGQFSL